MVAETNASHAAAQTNPHAEWERLHAAYIAAGKVTSKAGDELERIMAAYEAEEVSLRPSIDWDALPGCSDPLIRRIYLEGSGDLDVLAARLGPTHSAGWGLGIVQLQKIREYRDLVAALDFRLNYSKTDERVMDLAGKECDAAFAMLEFPAPDYAAVAWKVDYLFGRAAEEMFHGHPEEVADIVHRLLDDAVAFAGGVA